MYAAMQGRVILTQIVDSITQLSAAVKPADFIYDFLTCFGAPKATIARLKSGALNGAKKEGCTLLRTKVYFEPLRSDSRKAATPMKAIDAAKRDSHIAASRPVLLLSGIDPHLVRPRPAAPPSCTQWPAVRTVRTSRIVPEQTK